VAAITQFACIPGPAQGHTKRPHQHLAGAAHSALEGWRQKHDFRFTSVQARQQV